MALRTSGFPFEFEMPVRNPKGRWQVSCWINKSDVRRLLEGLNVSAQMPLRADMPG